LGLGLGFDMFHLTSDRGGNVANSGRSTTAAVWAL